MIFFIHNFSDTSYSKGVSNVFRKEIDVNVNNVHRSNDARKLLAYVKIYDDLITFLNVYAPNNENAHIAFFNRLKSFTKTLL